MNSRELVLVLGMVTVLVVCREKDSQVFPCFCCFGSEARLCCMLKLEILVRKILVCWWRPEFWETVL